MGELGEEREPRAARRRAKIDLDHGRRNGELFAHAVRLTRMPMLLAEPTAAGCRISYANPAFLALSGYGLGELIGRDPQLLNGPGTEPEAIAAYCAAIAAQRHGLVELYQHSRDGRRLRLALAVTPLRDRGGTVTHYFHSYIDVTARLEAEEALARLRADLEERARRAADLERINAQLAARMAEHEMLLSEVNHRAKNSLAIAASLLRLHSPKPASDAIADQLAEAREGLRAMAHVHELLSHATSSQRIDFSRYVFDICAALRAMTDHDRIRLEPHGEAGIFVEADAAFPLALVLAELITNAIKYAYPPPSRGVIVVRASRIAERRGELLVRDHGIGMGELRREGLGFDLVRALVRQMHGELRLENHAGVAAVVSFPLA